MSRSPSSSRRRLARAAWWITAAAAVVSGLIAAPADAATARRDAPWPPPWTIQAPVDPAVSTISRLSGVSCPATSACMADGFSFTGAKTDALAEVWNGTSWTIEPTGPPGGVLTGVSCISATACLAVGYSGSDSLAETWNGSGWRTVLDRTPSGADASRLNGVSCMSATGCIAVGQLQKAYNFFTFAVSWKGGNWAVLSTANLSATDNRLNGVSCTSASTCLAVGRWQDFKGVNHTLAQTWNGAGWSYDASPDPAGTLPAFSGVSCSAATACTAVGSYTGSGGTIRPLAERRT